MLVLALVAIFLLRAAGPRADLHRIDRQNVLLVTIDTLRADAPSCYGGPAATPALDRLATEGVRFEFAHAHAVLTLPSHASILTGEYPFQHGVRSNSGYRLPRGSRTLATMLKQAGYATAAFVAAFPVHSLFGLNAGFDVYDDNFGGASGPVTLNTPERPASVVVPLARAWIADRTGSGKNLRSPRCHWPRRVLRSSTKRARPGRNGPDRAMRSSNVRWSPRSTLLARAPTGCA